MAGMNRNRWPACVGMTGRHDRNTQRLRLQHPHRISQTLDAIPAQLQVEVETAANEMHMTVVQARDEGPPARLYHPRRRSAQTPDLPFIITSSQNKTIPNGQMTYERS